jgi:hypothetical protein
VPFLVPNVLILVALSAGPALAQVTGKVIGTVTDGDTGLPLVGAQIAVEGTNLGNVTDQNGSYFINNVSVGIGRFTAQYLGYRTLTREERVLAGQTMTVDFALAGEVVEAERIVALIEREPLVVRDNTISKSRFTGEEVRGLPTGDLSDVITLGAGIYESTVRGFIFEGQAQTGFVIRGGRVTESATYVDGGLITDFRTQSNQTGVGEFAVEEVDVVTGGFNAEFGHAQSGIVNLVTREGGLELHGSLRFTTDGRFGTDGYDVPALAAGRIPEAEKCCGYNALQGSIGGPIVPGRLTFFGSLEAEGAADFSPSAAGFNPAMGDFNSSGSTTTILPGNRGDRTRIQAKVTSFPTATSRLSGTYLYSRDQLEIYDDLTTGNLLFGLRQHLGDATRTKTHDVIVGWDQQLFQTAERSLNLQVRGHLHQTLTHAGTPLNPISAELLLGTIGEECGADCETAIDLEEAFGSDILNYRFGDVRFFFEDAIPGGGPFGLPATRSSDPDPVFGIPRLFVSEAFQDFFDRLRERRYTIRADLDGQLNRVHRLKVGAEWTWLDLAERGGSLQSLIFGELFDVDPRIGALYVQDRLDYGDLVIDVGLRLDHWDPNTRFPRFPGVVSCEISAFDLCSEPADDPLAALVEGRTRTELAPRVGVAHPITDATQVRLSYGVFHQLPELRNYFDHFNTEFSGNPNTIYGNPNLDYIETKAFEAGITHLLSENTVLDIVGYNRDRRGAIRLDVFQQDEIATGVGERRTFLNADNGNVKGVDISLSRRYSNYVSTDVAYSLQFARGTTSSPFEFVFGFGSFFDPLNPGRLVTPPTELSAESFDRTHTFNGQLNLQLPGDFRAGTTIGSIFRDFGIYLVYNAHSGEPFTRVSIVDGRPLEGFNSSRLPWLHQGDVRVTKGFGLGEALGIEAFLEVINVLDNVNILRVNPTSGQPDVTGFEEGLSQTPTIPSELKIEGAPEGFPIGLDQIAVEFRDEFARQDLDGDGVITLAEAQLRLRQALQATGSEGFNGDSPYNYGEPRQIRFGAELRF